MFQRTLQFLSILLSLSLTVTASADPFAYITNNGSNDVSVIDTASNKVTATIPVSANPGGIAINPRGDRAYVVNAGSNNVSVIDTTSNRVIFNIPVGDNPSDIAVNPTGTRAYVTNIGSGDKFPMGTVSVIDLVSNRVITTIPVGIEPGSVTVNPAGTRVYVTAIIGGFGISVIDASTNKVVGTIEAGMPYDLLINPSGTLLYVAGAGEYIDVFSTSNDQRVARIPVPMATDPIKLAMNPDGTRLYVTNHTNPDVTVIDTQENQVIATIPFESYSSTDFSSGISVNPAGTAVYVATPGDKISVIDTSNHRVFATVPVGEFPSDIAFGNPMGGLDNVSFSSFSPRLLLAGQLFNLSGTLVLNNASDGIDPASEAITLKLNGFSLAIPAGSLRQAVPSGVYTFSGQAGGMPVTVQLLRRDTREFFFNIAGRSPQLAQLRNPVSITWSIGNDYGTGILTVPGLRH